MTHLTRDLTPLALIVALTLLAALGRVDADLVVGFLTGAGGVTGAAVIARAAGGRARR